MGREPVEAALRGIVPRETPGVALVVARRGGPHRAEAAGVSDLDSHAPLRPDTVQPWYSMTKIVTATAAMQLAEDGAPSLDDPVGRFLPGFPRLRGGGPPVLVRHLLSHSSGLSNPIPVRWVHGADAPRPDRREAALRLLEGHSRLRSRPGESAAYSNLGYIALGEVIASAGGGSYEDHVRERILEPLGMASTGFSYEGLGGDVATGYQRRLSPMTPLFRLLLPKGIIRGTSGRFLAFNRFYVDGAAYGGLIGSAADAARFMAAHLGGGELDGARILSREGVGAMQSIQARGRRLEVGLGWTRRGGEAHLEHLGGGGGFWTMMRIHPGIGLGILTMGNATRYDHERLAAAALAETRP